MSDRRIKPVAPPTERTPQGDMRRVGVEVEFANIRAKDAARLVESLYGGSCEEAGEHRVKIADTRIGDFVVELDWQGAHQPESRSDRHDLAHRIESNARETAARAVSGVVPTEVVCPPVAWNELTELDPLFDGLRELGARGTRAGVLYAFGLHLNPEVADTSADYILRHLQAYVVLEDWLREQIDIDLTRRLLPHIEPFTRAYVLQILDPDYHPDLEHLIRDYAAENQTRNRGLDMTPLFRHLDEASLRDSIRDISLVKARPTFHYRLPNTRMSDTGWNAVVEWNRWVEVERLAADPERLASKRDARAKTLSQSVSDRLIETVKGWMS